MSWQGKKQGALLLGLGGVALLAAVVGIPNLVSIQYDPNVSAASSTFSAPQPLKASIPEPEPVLHVKTPEAVKAIYVSACAAATPSYRNAFDKLLRETEINSLVIDIKDFTGTVSFPTENPKLEAGTYGNGCRVSDMKEYIRFLHENGVYVIGRITVFQDPTYTKRHPELAVQTPSGEVWRDRKGLSFVDVGSKPFWEYIVELSKESYEIGFDELNFDYIRFPSDGDMQNIVFTQSVETGKTKAAALKEFFEYLDGELSSVGVMTSADLFGMVTSAQNDMGIGQILENAMPYFDYIAPMVYPSHYPNHWKGYGDPNKYPYEIIKTAMDDALYRQEKFKIETASSTPDAPFLKRLEPNQFRPWLQDNDYPVHYSPDMVRAQIQATYDAGLNSWMLWDAGNTYTRAALKEKAKEEIDQEKTAE